jgi:hypothetical protein
MRRIFFALIALAAVASAACRQYDVDVYRNVNGKVPRGQPFGVSQSFVCTADSLLWAEFFVGAANTPGPLNYYGLEITDPTTNDVMYSGTKGVTGQHYEYVRFDTLDFFRPLVKGKEYVLKVTLDDPNHPEDSLNFYYDPTNPYKYGSIQFPDLGYHPPPQPWMPDSDLCCRIEGVNRAVRRELAGKTWGRYPCFRLRRVLRGRPPG